MELFDIVQLGLDVQSCGPGGDGICPAAAFTAVGAAFSTVGYWVQSDILDLLTFQTFGAWAVVLYIGAAFVGMLGVATGQPPRNYVWFFIGPALYAWLLDTRTPVHGVEWRVAGARQDQAEVWKLAEAGLINTNQFLKFNQISTFDGSGWGNNAAQVFKDNVPTQPVRVAFPFAWYDEVISHSIQWLVKWTGMGWLTNPDLAGIPAERRNIAKRPWGMEQDCDPDDADCIDGEWFLLSNLKWTFLNNVTGAKLSSPALRDAFVSFTASECGDKMFENLDNAKFLAAHHTYGKSVPDTVFRDADRGYADLIAALRTVTIPMPASVKEFIKRPPGASAAGGGGGPASVGSFFESVLWNDAYSGGSSTTKIGLRYQDRIRCDAYLDLMITAFRWEAGHIYHQAFYTLPKGVNDIEAIYAMLYGWAVKEPQSNVPLGENETENMRKFVTNLILVYLVRNEMSIARQPMDLRFSSSTQTRNVTEEWNRQLGSRQKYGELYTWAMLVPYLQGILLYLLAIAYPFACIAIVVPGWHKTILTWASFYLWVKLWDLGFAVVGSIEKSLWAMLGNSSRSADTFERIVQMQEHGMVRWVCNGVATGGGGAATPIRGMDGNLDCVIPEVFVTNATGQLVNLGAQTFQDNLKLFDIAMTLSPNIDIDISNVYYIYIMAALYLAVPAVTGQLVLGAKAGAASMVNSAVGGSAQEAGRAAGAGFQGDVVQRAKSNANAIGQEAMAKSYRATGLAGRALSAGNSAASERVSASVDGTIGESLRRGDDLNSRTWQAGAEKAEIGGGLISKELGRIGGGGAGSSGGGGSRRGEAGSAGQGAGAQGSGIQGAGDAGGGQPGINGGLNLNGGAGGGGGAGAGAGAAPQGGAGNAGNMRGGAPGIGSRLLSGLGSRAGQYSDAAVKLGNSGWRDEQNLASAAMQGEAMDRSISQAGATARASGFEQHGSRTGEHGQFSAEMARWNALNTHANRIGSNATALGLIAGGLDPGPKPGEMNGMAMSGMLNTYNADGSTRDNTRAAANWFNPSGDRTGSGYFGAARRQFGGQERDPNTGYRVDEGQLGRDFGRRPVQGMYTKHSVGSATAKAVGHGVDEIGNAVGRPQSAVEPPTRRTNLQSFRPGNNANP